jgi:hyperosmotically inducible periplasmic protein
LNRILFLFVVFAAFSFGALPAAAQGNSRLDRQIRREILTLPYYGVFDAIGYQTSGESVADIEGVGRVTNNIQVLPLSPSDDRLRIALLRRLSNAGGLYRYFLGANPGIRIIVNRGRVSLEGYVSNRGDANLANITARSVPGSFAVNNNLVVDSGTPR